MAEESAVNYWEVSVALASRKAVQAFLLPRWSSVC